MAKLLTADCFDSFLLTEAQIVTANSYTIDGRLQKSFFTTEEWQDQTIHPYEFAQWKDMRSVIFSLIKGKHTPVRMQIQLQLKPELTGVLLPGGRSVQEETSLISSLQCQMRYENGQISLVSGVAYRSFSMDKEPEREWDNWIRHFLAEKGIAFEEE